MKGVILGGGLGTRMGYYTNRVTQKHLIYVYNRAMVEYPLSSLVDAGVQDVVVVTGGRYSGQLIDYIGNGKEFGCNANYARQYGEGGIADALRCARPFCGDSPVCVILGDNLFEDSLQEFVSTYKGGGKILLKEVPNPTSYGVATLDEEGKIIRVVEKPKVPESNLAIVGAYIFDSDVFDVIETLKPSGRGELEVTDLILHYLKQGRLEYTKLNGYWTDMGSPDTLLEAARYLKDHPLSRLDLFKVDHGISIPASQLEKWWKATSTVDYGGGAAWVAEIEAYCKLAKKWDLK
jgi:glucose-1-phosphate thymidylyltransferase